MDNQENDHSIKKKINLEVEVDAISVEKSENPYQRWVHLAKTIDAWRIFPRIFVAVYIILLGRWQQFLEYTLEHLVKVKSLKAKTNGCF